MKEKNEPVLFVNSVSVYRSSDTSRSNVRLHRLDDIKVLLNLNQKIIVEVVCFDTTITAIIKQVNTNEIILLNEFGEITINLSKIKEIKIIRTE